MNMERGQEAKPEHEWNRIMRRFPMIQTATMEHPETGERQIVKGLRSFGIGNTCDVRQTDFDPLPETPMLVDRLGVDNAAKALDRRLSWPLQDEGFRLAKWPIGSTRAFSAPDATLITVNLEAPLSADDQDLRGAGCAKTSTARITSRAI
jgi:hypothetical protein